MFQAFKPKPLLAATVGVATQSLPELDGVTSDADIAIASAHALNRGGHGLGSDDVALVVSAQQGNEDAFRRLVERYQNRIYRFLLKHAVSHAEAEELTQEVFLQAFISLRHFNGHSQYLTWLTGIALNLVRNWISRSPGRQLEVELEGMPHPYIEPAAPEWILFGSNPELAAAKAAALKALVVQFENLPADARECLMLVAMEDMSYDEVALLRGEPVGSIKSRVSRARKLLREQLPAEHFEALAGNLSVP